MYKSVVWQPVGCWTNRFNIWQKKKKKKKTIKFHGCHALQKKHIFTKLVFGVMRRLGELPLPLTTTLPQWPLAAQAEE